ncbi:MAG: phosphatidylserine/phosphatidylglycerophosphate/cardiolipin synthase family protein [Novosphingobium sp.]|nr:phosphatidylserine/phosphatidylglycerophosphate/cardiolipin synthase family protein [Novosphingobium sp.]
MEIAEQFQDGEPFDVRAQGHDFTFYPSGKDRLAALLELIASARASIHLFYYFVADDDSGRQVRDALVEAARRGVETRLVVDGFGTHTRQIFFQPIIDAGGRFAMFNARRTVRYLIRNHQKMAIADGERAMIGGLNVAGPYFAPPTENGWHDLGVMVAGPVVKDLARWFAGLARWADEPHAKFLGVRRMVRQWNPGNGPVRLLVGGPTRVPSNWSRTVRRDLAQASRLDLVMAYFSPPRSFRRLIGRIGKCGNARIIMAAKSDNTATIGAARALYGSLLRAGVKIMEFQPCKLHKKLLVIDDNVYVGSANFDMRSIRLNLELMLRVEDPGLAETMRAHIDMIAAASEEITPALHLKRATIFSRLRWRLGLFLVNVLDYTVTRRLNP